MAGLGTKLLAYCSSAKSLFIAAPYIKKGALVKVLEAARETDSIVCVTRWRPEDILVGVSDVGCRNLVTGRGGSFRLHPHLHAKYYRFDNNSLIGSANLTPSAMGWVSQPNFEILCSAGTDFDQQAFERELVRDSREVSDTEFTRWNSLHRIAAQERGKTALPKRNLGNWRPSTRDTKNLVLAYQEREDEIASIDEKRAAARDLRILAMPLGLNKDDIRVWISTCLLATPFANSVMQQKGRDKLNAAKTLAATYGLGATEARRDMEAVDNWLSFLNLSD